MNAAAIAAILGLINQALPLFTSSPQIGSVIDTIEKLVPIAIQEGVDVMQPIKNIIAAVGTNPATDDAQLATLAALDAQMDAAFDAAADAFNKAHPV